MATTSIRELQIDSHRQRVRSFAELLPVNLSMRKDQRYRLCKSELCLQVREPMPMLGKYFFSKTIEILA
jgi:hypothetical protein